MIKKTTAFFLCAFMISSSLFAFEKTNRFDSTDLQGNLRLFYKSNKLRFLFQYSYNNSQREDPSQSVLLETKYAFNQNIRFGFGLKRSSGIRHDEDWQNMQWSSSQDRFETNSYLRLSYRALLPFQINGMFELRSLFDYNHFNDNVHLRLRPGINWSLNSHHIINTSAEFYFPLNYSDQTIYERWFYIAHLYKLNSNLKFGPMISLGHKTWMLQKDKLYEKLRILRVGLNLNFYL